MVREVIGRVLSSYIALQLAAVATSLLLHVPSSSF